ncbi:MAG TPA: DNA/RNA nuclease SfsA [Candidatus Hydrogenedentes bacterium]|nr:DNA/RNA nuclease SfsA [Candidatus Hydrogenedentota bacterium]
MPMRFSLALLAAALFAAGCSRNDSPQPVGEPEPRAEAPVGRSRFDFLLRDAEGDLYLEVKSCTLFGNGVAMFPDAVTERGRRHLLELAELARDGVRAAVLFVVHTPNVRWFMPDYHTDLAFSRTLLDVRDRVRILPVSVTWRDDLTLAREARLLEIPWAHIDREARDSGAYLLLLELEDAARIEVGALGTVSFRRGHYVYVGSAMANLAARMARHLRPHKTRHWHIDYLRPRAARVEALAVRASSRLECDLAHALGRVLEPGPRGFGCTDCACATHLFFSAAPPLDRRDVHDILERFRMRQPQIVCGSGSSPS